MHGRRKYQVRRPQLPYAAEALELRRVDQLHFQGAELDVPMNRVSYEFFTHRGYCRAARRNLREGYKPLLESVLQNKKRAVTRAVGESWNELESLGIPPPFQGGVAARLQEMAPFLDWRSRGSS